jgi:hypothetical protein
MDHGIAGLEEDPLLISALPYVYVEDLKACLFFAAY